jgi:hypothetical protein
MSGDSAARAELIELVESVCRLPYGRPSDRSVAGMLREGRGTCSTKHLHLAGELLRRFPQTRPRIVHRVYRIDAEGAARTFGEHAAAAVPADGVVDVHRASRSSRRLPAIFSTD